MNQTIPGEVLEEVGRQVAGCMGLHFPRSKWPALEQGLACAARELGFGGPGEFAKWFISAPPSRETTETVASHLTVGETYFLREMRCFEILEQEIIPEILRNRRGGEQRLRIWSAGCATGEEPYSVAIMLHRMREALKGWEVSILATDINRRALKKAGEGVYTEWSFRSPPKGFREHYFSRTGNGLYELSPHIKKMVNFAWLNLAEDIYPSLAGDTNAMDVILCRNVLMYFEPELAKRVVDRLRLCLVDGGWLVVSPCEGSGTLSDRFAAVNFPGAILYRKTGCVPQKREPKTPAPVTPLPDRWPPAPRAAPAPPPKGKKPHPPAAVPPPPPSPCETALSLYEQGLYGKAAEVLSLHLSKNGGDAPALALLSRILANEGKLSEALKLSGKAIAADKMSAGLHYLRAVILQETGAAEEAGAELGRALYLDQEFVLAHFSLGNLALRLGKAKEARRHFGNALRLLRKYRLDEILPESEGIPAGRLAEIIEATAAGSAGDRQKGAEQKRLSQ
ncbi:chemotaxis protein CheR [bacterium]|nr:MAG: chemotaxis protein CheR [bacterium]